MGIGGEKTLDENHRRVLAETFVLLLIQSGSLRLGDSNIFWLYNGREVTKYLHAAKWLITPWPRNMWPIFLKTQPPSALRVNLITCRPTARGWKRNSAIIFQYYCQNSAKNLRRQQYIYCLLVSCKLAFSRHGEMARRSPETFGQSPYGWPKTSVLCGLTKYRFVPTYTVRGHAVEILNTVFTGSNLSYTRMIDMKTTISRRRCC